MTSRIVTVTLAVAMGLLVNGVALSQSEAPPPDPLVLIPTFDELPQSGLPLGELSPEMQESIARLPPPDLSHVEPNSGRIHAIRRWVSRAPRSGIALAFGVLCAALAAGWALGAASRGRAWRAYRRQPRSAGGSRLRGLEEVVASVQFAHSRSPGGPPGPEWPDQS